jgi:AcrR family transcriptional regulator
MPPNQFPAPTRRADAERNRDKILATARSAFADPEADISMAEVSRRAGVGMATLYRNVPGRREFLEALYTDEVDAICEAAGSVGARYLEPILPMEYQPPRTVVAMRRIAATLITAVASHPNVLLNRPLVCSPMTLRSEPSRVIRIRSGGATSPLITAVANRALIGSMPTKFMANPPSIPNASTP